MQQTETQSIRRGMSTLNTTDRNFLIKSAQGSLLEFATSQLAVQKAQNPEVAQYAMRLMKDHAQYNMELMQLARQNRVILPVELDSKDRSTLQRLMKLQGAAFDREYTQETAQANREDIEDMQRASKNAQAQSVQAFISKFLPVQQQHLELATALKGNSTKTTGNR